MTKQKISRGEKEARMREFQTSIVEIMTKDKVTAMEAIVHYVDVRNMDIQDIEKLISPTLKKILYDDAVANRLIKDTELHLPI